MTHSSCCYHWCSCGVVTEHLSEYVCFTFVSTFISGRSIPGDASAYRCICHTKQRKKCREHETLTERGGNVIPLDSQVFLVTFRNHKTKKKKKRFWDPLWHYFVSCGRTFVLTAESIVHTTNPGSQSSLVMPVTWLRSVVQLHDIVLSFCFLFLSLTLKSFSPLSDFPIDKKSVTCFQQCCSVSQLPQCRSKWWWFLPISVLLYCWTSGCEPACVSDDEGDDLDASNDSDDDHYEMCYIDSFFFLRVKRFGVECWKVQDSSSMYLCPPIGAMTLGQAGDCMTCMSWRICHAAKILNRAREMTRNKQMIHLSHPARYVGP